MGARLSVYYTEIIVGSEYRECYVNAKYLFCRFRKTVVAVYVTSTKDIKDLTPEEGKTEISQTPKGKIAGLQRDSAELETNRNLSRGCLRFFRLALLLVFGFFSH